MSERDLVSYLLAEAIQSATYNQDDLSELDKKWLFTKSETIEPFSFDWCCEVLGLHSDYIREGLFTFMPREKLGRDKGPGILNN